MNSAGIRFAFSCAAALGAGASVAAAGARGDWEKGGNSVGGRARAVLF